jgi:hypothetical protein
MRPRAVEVFAITGGYEMLNLRQYRMVSFCRPTETLFVDTRVPIRGTNRFPARLSSRPELLSMNPRAADAQIGIPGQRTTLIWSQRADVPAK